MPKASDLGFSDSDPSEMSFAQSAAEDEYTNALHSDNPSRVAQALGIDAAKAKDLDPSAILQMGRSKVRDYEVRRGNQIQTREASKQDQANAGRPIDESYLESQVGNIDVKSVHDVVSKTTGSDNRDKQQQYWSDLPKQIASEVENHNPKGAYKKALNYLTLSKQMDALYFGTQGNPATAGMAGVAQAKPKTGMYEQQALNLLFDTNHKILPDYLSHADMQSLGLAPSTNMGGAAAPGSTPVNRNVGPDGTPSFGNVGPGAPKEDTALPPGSPPFLGNTPGVAPGAQSPTPNVGAPSLSPPVNPVIPPSPSQARIAGGQPLVTSGEAPPPTGAAAGQSPIGAGARSAASHLGEILAHTATHLSNITDPQGLAKTATDAASKPFVAPEKIDQAKARAAQLIQFFTSQGLPPDQAQAQTHQQLQQEFPDLANQ